MNIRKPTDYITMFTTLDTLMAAQLPQMELYCEIGRVVSGRAEKGAAVAASEYLQAAYPTAEGFSPRNLRRMRAFYAAYEKTPEIMRLAMHLGYIQKDAVSEDDIFYSAFSLLLRKIDPLIGISGAANLTPVEGSPR